MLDEFGKIAAAEIVFYAPVLCIAFFVTLKHGFSRREGWASLLIFSVVRILGAILSVVSKTELHPTTGLLITVGILQAMGLSPLLLATLGFVTNIAQYGLPSLSNIMRLLRLDLAVAVVLAIIGGIKTSPNNSSSDQATGHTLLRVGAVLFVIAYVVLFGIHVLLWGKKENIPLNHKKLLTSLSFALPFLAVKVLYSVLGAFVPSPSQWSSTTGDWKLYLVMGLLMEYIVVCIYVITGARLPLQEEEAMQIRGHIVPMTANDGFIEMGNKKYIANDPY
ncbi:hypothetical protein K439DRAFT_111065 [Ramaria rubella]|nr:hypothetical protein K439DRAFT_111065 [Ramaria rubella]